METLRLWATRLRMLLRRNGAEFDDELAFHLQREVEQNLAAGMTATEARRQAMVAFGGVERTRQQWYEARPGHWLETFFEDVRYALRGFARNRIFTATVVVTLALGIGATTAVFSVVDRILFRSLPYAQADRLVSVGMVHSLETQGFLMGNFYYTWRDNQKPFEEMTSESTGTHECDLTEGTPTQLECEAVEGNFLSTLGVSPALGRNFLLEEARPGGPQVALISYRLWLTRYGLDPRILNKTIAIDGSPIRVIGVLPRNFEMPRLQSVDVLTPMAVDEIADHKANGGYGAPRRAFARLKPNVTLQHAQAALQALFQDAMKQIPSTIRKDVHLSVRSLRDVQMQNVRLMAWVLLGSVISVLLIACANVASLLMARAAGRQKERAIRSALGASKTRLICQALTEAMLLSLAGASAGCVLAQGLLRLFIRLAPAGLPFISKAQLDLRVIAFSIAASLLCGVFFGLASALQQPDTDLLTGRAIKGVAHASMRQWLVAGQIAASMILLAVAMLLVKSFRNLENQQLGMRVDNTLTANLTLGAHDYPTVESQIHFTEQLRTRLMYGPGVSMVAVTDTLPLEASHSGRRLNQIIVSGQPSAVGDAGDVVTSRWISPNYFRALDIPIVQGRDFSAEDVTSSERPVILSRTLAARLFYDRSPIGQRLQFNSPSENAPSYTVVGVVENVKNNGLMGEEVPEYYRLRRSRSDSWDANGTWSRTVVFVVRSSLPVETTSRWMRTQIADVDARLPADIVTLRQRVSKLADQPRFQTVLVGLFACTGLIMAVIGLYGVIAFLVTQRTAEIGVRMALGASRGAIFRLVMVKSLKLIGWGTLFGLFAALSVSRVLTHLLFSVGPYDPLSYGLVTILLVGTGLVATLVPARSAVRVDPATVLRSE